MQYALGVLGALGFVLFFTTFRFLQFKERCRYVVQYAKPSCTPVIFMSDYFRNTPQLVARLDATAALYYELKGTGKNPLILLTVGWLKLGEKQICVSQLNKNALIERGVPEDSIRIHMGWSGRGAADTFGEIALVCQWLHEEEYVSAFFVADFVHNLQNFYLAAWYGVRAVPKSVECCDSNPSLLVRRLVALVLTFFDPRGLNPLSVAVRLKRRYVSAG